jgi:hypothetical protein
MLSSHCRRAKALTNAGRAVLVFVLTALGAPPAWGQLSPQWYQGEGLDFWGGKIDCFHPANNSVAGGFLTQTTRAENIPCVGDGNFSNGSNLGFTSSIVTFKNFNFTYGVVEYRMKFSSVHETVWLLGSKCQPAGVGCNWPKDVDGAAEIDISEGILPPWQMGQYIHIQEGPGVGCGPSLSDVRQNYHVYRLEWTPQAVVFKVDGAETCSSTDSVPKNPMFLMSTAVMDNANGTYPVSSSIDYVRVCPMGTLTCDQAHATLFDEEFDGTAKANLSGGGLAGSVTAAASSYDLASGGTSDWAHFTRGGTIYEFDHKASGGGQISSAGLVGPGYPYTGNWGVWHDNSRSVTWTNGAPTASLTNEHDYVYTNSALGSGFAFLAPADTTVRTLKIYCGGNATTGTLTAHLSDGSAADYVSSQSGSGL